VSVNHNCLSFSLHNNSIDKVDFFTSILHENNYFHLWIIDELKYLCNWDDLPIWCKSTSTAMSACACASEWVIQCMLKPNLDKYETDTICTPWFCIFNSQASFNFHWSSYANHLEVWTMSILQINFLI